MLNAATVNSTNVLPTSILQIIYARTFWSTSRRDPIRVTREHGRFSDVVQAKVEKNNSIKADSSTSMGRDPVFKAIYVRLDRLGTRRA